MVESKEFPMSMVLQQRWQFDKLPSQWAEAMLQHKEAILQKSKEECQDWFVQVVSKHPLFCAHFYRCTVLECSGNVPGSLVKFEDSEVKRELRIAIGKQGISLLTIDYELLWSFEFDSVHEWRSTDDCFSCSVAHGTKSEEEADLILGLGTSHSASMQAAVVSFIHARASVS